MGKRAALLPAAGHGRGAQLLPICPIARAGSCPQIAARTRKAHAALSFSLKRSEPLFLGLDQLLHQFADLPGLLLRDVDVLDHRALELDADRKSTRLNSSHTVISYAVFCLKK